MTLRQFLKDRFLYILSFYLTFLLVLTVVVLLFFAHGYEQDWYNLMYMLLLVSSGLFLTLLVDYLRQRMYYRNLHILAQADSVDLEAPLYLQNAVTEEQKQLLHVLQNQHKAYLDTLARYRVLQETHQHFTQQWVHQMKTPVSVIHLLVQQAKAEEQDKQRNDWLDSVDEENDRMAHGLEMMLHTARLEKFELDMRVSRVRLDELLRHVINEHKKEFIRWSIFPKITIESSEPFVETDEKWMTFVVHQLVSNAIKYSKDKPLSKQLLLRVEPIEQGCLLQVQDQGIGIHPHDLPRVFDAFFTGENRRVRTESTGMGLYLAKQVCQRLGHRIEIRSTLDEGTTVTICFKTETLFRLD